VIGPHHVQLSSVHRTLYVKTRRHPHNRKYLAHRKDTGGLSHGHSQHAWMTQFAVAATNGGGALVSDEIRSVEMRSDEVKWDE